MKFSDWLVTEEIAISGEIKPTQPDMKWPDLEKASPSIYGDDTPWAFYLGNYQVGGRNIVLKMSRHKDDPKTMHIDGMSSQGDNQFGLQQLLPRLKADGQRLGITNVKWSAATSNFGRKGPMSGRNRTPEQEAAIRNRLFNRLAGGFKGT